MTESKCKGHCPNLSSDKYPDLCLSKRQALAGITSAAINTPDPKKRSIKVFKIIEDNSTANPEATRCHHPDCWKNCPWNS